MTKCLGIIGLMLLFVLPLTACATTSREAGVVPPDGQELHDKSKENACDCCNKCRAAKGTMKSREEERKESEENELKKTQPAQAETESDGCEDCCARCGKELKPQSQDVPPEVIEHKLRPELK